MRGGTRVKEDFSPWQQGTLIRPTWTTEILTHVV